MTIFNNKKPFLTYLIIGIIVVFCGGFITYTVKNKFYPNKNKEVEKSVVVNTTKNSNPLKNIKIILNITYLKSGQTLQKSVIDGDQFKKADVKDVIAYYEDQDYAFQSSDSNKIVFCKKLDLYSPNKYFIGIKSDKLAIFKTDEDGNAFIENEEKDITNISTKNLSPGDIDMINRGDIQFQFDTRDGAASKLEDYI